MPRAPLRHALPVLIHEPGARFAPDPTAAERDLRSRYRERLVALTLPDDAGERRNAVAAAVEGWLRADGVAGSERHPGLLTELVDDLVMSFNAVPCHRVGFAASNAHLPLRERGRG